ncbi:MAG: DEAD/DEAH box helicase [Flavobacteriales bacterium]
MNALRNKTPLSLVFSIVEGELTDYTVLPYFVRFNQNGSVTAHSVAHKHSLESEGIEMTDDILQIFQLINENDIPSLKNKFENKKKDDIYKLWRHKGIRKNIRKHIDLRLNKILHLIVNNEFPVYFCPKGKLTVAQNKGKAVFYFHKKEEGIEYYLKLDKGGNEMNVRDSDLHIITDDPGWIVVENELVPLVKGLNGRKFEPFLEKDFLKIPRKSEKKYFRNFILKAVKNARVETEGFDIIDRDIEPKAELRIEYNHFLGKYCLMLYFRYEDRVFLPSFTENEEVVMKRIIRQKKWEGERIEALKGMDVRSVAPKVFLPKSLSDKERNVSFEDLLTWLWNHEEELKKNGLFVQKIDVEGQTYVTTTPSLDHDFDYKNDWFDLKAKVRLGDYVFSFTDLKENILNGNKEFQLPDGSIAILPDEWFEQYRSIFLHGNTVDNSVKLPKGKAGLLKGSRNLRKKLKKVIEDIEPSKEKLIDTPEGVQTDLREYQKSGLSWMYNLYQNGLGGCLADDMGLGKTVQVLSLLQYLSKNELNGHHSQEKEPAKQASLFDISENGDSNARLNVLIVMPSSLIHNWKNEIAKFTPGLSYYAHRGGNRYKTPEPFSEHNIAMTTYDTLRIDIEIIENVRFDYLILDESQYIKNPFSKTYAALKRVNADNKLALTGTPLENSLSDLWAQMNMVNPGLLNAYEKFKDEYIATAEKKNDKKKRDELRNLVNPFIKRRKKSEVEEDLPSCTEKVFYTEMTEEQKSIYEAEKSKARNEILQLMEKGGKKAKAGPQVLNSLTKLRQIVDHPRLCETNLDEESGKFNDVLDHIHNLIDQGHKMIVFSQFVKYLDMFSKKLDNEDVSHKYLTGKTPGNKRESIIKDFKENEDIRVFLISLKAGGVGLNLEEADHVLLLDPWWNPAVEKQAIDRVHRIGQDKRVFAYKFITVDSIEEKILKLQDKKKVLADDILPGDEEEPELTAEEVGEMLE